MLDLCHSNALKMQLGEVRDNPHKILGSLPISLFIVSISIVISINLALSHTHASLVDASMSIYLSIFKVSLRASYNKRYSIPLSHTHKSLVDVKKISIYLRSLSQSFV